MSMWSYFSPILNAFCAVLSIHLAFINTNVNNNSGFPYLVLPLKSNLSRKMLESSVSNIIMILSLLGENSMYLVMITI